MEYLVIFLIVVVILGALAGGKSFGETISQGLGCLVIIIVVIVGIALFVSNKKDKKEIDTSITSQNTKHTVCVYNDSGYDINLTVGWQGACSDAVHSVKNGHSSSFSCDKNLNSLPDLGLGWKGYKTEYYSFKKISNGGCNSSNSLRVNPSKFGYEWSVSYGKWK